MKLRLLPVVLSVIISSAVLFGGWFAYTSLAMENPLSDIIGNAPGVESSTMKLDSTQVNIELKLKQDANLREIVRRIQTEGSSIIGKRSLHVEVTDKPSAKIEEWWSKALFEVAQAMETKHYADIPTTLQKYAADVPNMKVDSEMDESYVYIHMTDGESSKFVMLPRSSKIGVWPNE
ncbi:hypothetical protein GK047_08415 [Paenibacillus sp. SYP-B3998]|uniref:Uncharacterized protein n=1 Tax=Paenibacillus sp. SYP-B3998 TaxID=2678564 RepID=A0A6G3ZWT1_9BACL|nr:hypothetical protein [Paenibacillus sp. SYP-B3998]NEW06031.1 hypothetical protein [Paenibacillus sp. SYP-B3998]